MPVPAILHEGRLERRLHTGHFREVDVAGDLLLRDRLEVEIFYLVSVCDDDPGLLRVRRVNEHLLRHGLPRRRAPSSAARPCGGGRSRGAPVSIRAIPGPPVTPARGRAGAEARPPSSQVRQGRGIAVWSPRSRRRSSSRRGRIGGPSSFGSRARTSGTRPAPAVLGGRSWPRPPGIRICAGASSEKPVRSSGGGTRGPGPSGRAAARVFRSLSNIAVRRSP